MGVRRSSRYRYRVRFRSGKLVCHTYNHGGSDGHVTVYEDDPGATRRTVRKAGRPAANATSGGTRDCEEVHQTLVAMCVQSKMTVTASNFHESTPVDRSQQHPLVAVLYDWEAVVIIITNCRHHRRDTLDRPQAYHLSHAIMSNRRQAGQEDRIHTTQRVRLKRFPYKTAGKAGGSIQKAVPS